MKDSINQNDFKKWNRFRRGDDSALSDIYSKNVESLYRYGLKFTTNRDIVEDIIHDLFLDLIRNRKTIGNTDNIKFYLLKSFRRKLVRKLKGEMRYDDEFSDMTFGVKYSIEQEIISEEIKDQTSKRLLFAIEKLSPRQKEAIYLKFKKGLDYQEISDLLGMGVEASRNLIYRAIKSLKETILSTGNNPILLFILKKVAHTIKKVQLR